MLVVMVMIMCHTDVYIISFLNFDPDNSAKSAAMYQPAFCLRLLLTIVSACSHRRMRSAAATVVERSSWPVNRRTAQQPTLAISLTESFHSRGIHFWYCSCMMWQADNNLSYILFFPARPSALVIRPFLHESDNLNHEPGRQERIAMAT